MENEMLTIILCKILCFFGNLIGRGSSLPGLIALRLDKNILSKIKLPDTVVAVTGSNGKTSTTELIREAAKAAGKRFVCNSEGSNQIEGVTTALLKSCNFKGEVQADVVILESDERFCQHTFSFFAPTHIVVTNIFRDQLTRNGNSEFVLGELEKGLPKSSVLILNADDPMSASLCEGRKNVIWYGIDKSACTESTEVHHAYNDGAFCPICKARMDYDYRIQAHLGGYRCTKCGFRRFETAHAVTATGKKDITLDGKYKIRPQINNLMFAYNIAAAFTVSVEVMKIKPDKAAKALDSHMLTSGRVRSFKIKGHKGLFMLSKHENSMSYNGTLKTIVDSESREMTVVLIVDLLSRKYVANDMSWLWDVDFELLADKRIKKIFVSGQFANDVACRLLFAGVEDERLFIEPNLDKMMDGLYEAPHGDVYVMTCFTDVGKFTKRLREESAE
ncbi:MAG: MurT ligase domain-containing protein [Oscillospiraceae bacterium]